MELYPHQKEALLQTESKNHVAYYHDMGLGKTFTGAEKMKQLGARVNLLICQKSKIHDWANHFSENYPQVWIFDLTKPKELTTFQRWAIAEVPAKAANVIIIGIVNYELAWRRKDLLKLKDFTLMLDESSLIQNVGAKQSKFVLKLHAKNVILLSGTPCSGKYENLWTQASLLGWDISEPLFNRQYVEYGPIIKRDGSKVLNPVTGRPIMVVKGYKNKERLKGKLREYGAVFLKTEEVLDLPAQHFISVKVQKSKTYNKFMKNSIATVGEIELVGDTNFTKLLYARQLCGQYSEEKLQAFRDLVQSTNDRLIVFYNFNEELAKLTQICEELNKPVSQINGSMKDLAAYEDSSNSVTLVQYQAGAMGLNLQKANKIIYFTLPQRSDLFEQSKKRIHRIGQEQPCYYYLMICCGTLEEGIKAALDQRRDYTDALFK